ncbi:MAG: DegV family protein [Anaerolineales bacterium]|nr:DegV family protein [Anaerolineales bacterium]MDW8161867.1 DegV family protein [Anaerolineales bacterium]
MPKVAIVTDSTAYIPENFLREYQISVAPQVLIWGDQTFEDGVDILPEEFYRRLKTDSVMPTTSQVTIPNFQKIFKNLLEQGKEVLAILISAKLSGTIDSAIQAKATFPSDAPIEIVDSYSTAMAMGLQVLTVARAAQNGASLAECKRMAEEARERTGVVFAVDTLEFLHRGGRIGGASRFLGTALNIKPLLEVRGGRVEPLERVRTRKKSLARLVEIIEERTKGKSPLRLSVIHANAEEEARELLEEVTQRLQPAEAILSTVSPVIGTHVGPGTVGIAYLTEM